MAERWTIRDNTKANGGYLQLLLDGQSVCIDIFPFKRGADPASVRAMASRIVDALNSIAFEGLELPHD